MSTAENLAQRLDLAPLDVCNGYFRETWRDDHSTVIYWLLPADHHAGLHRARHPEIFTYHGGAPLRFTLLHPDGRLVEHIVGPDVERDQHPHLVVPGGVWQATHTLGEYSLASVVVSPPFTPDIVATADIDALCAEFPQHAEKLRELG